MAGVGSEARFALAGADEAPGAEEPGEDAPAAPASIRCSPPDGETGRPEVVARAMMPSGVPSPPSTVTRSAEGRERRTPGRGARGDPGADASPGPPSPWTSTSCGRGLAGVPEAAPSADRPKGSDAVESVVEDAIGDGLADVDAAPSSDVRAGVRSTGERRRSKVGGGGKARAAVRRAAAAADDGATSPALDGGEAGAAPPGFVEAVREAPGRAPPAALPVASIVVAGGAGAGERWPGAGLAVLLTSPPRDCRLSSDTSEARADGAFGVTGPARPIAPAAPMRESPSEAVDRDVRCRDGAG